MAERKISTSKRAILCNKLRKIALMRFEQGNLILNLIGSIKQHNISDERIRKIIKKLGG